MTAKFKLTETNKFNSLAENCKSKPLSEIPVFLFFESFYFVSPPSGEFFQGLRHRFPKIFACFGPLTGMQELDKAEWPL